MTPEMARRSPDPAQIIDAAVEEYRRRTHTPGVCVAVFHDQGDRQLELIRPYGLARLKPVVKVTADTVFGLGSVTKVFTSLLLANAVNEGHAQLNDPVIQFLSKQYGVEGSEKFKTIRLRDLATHTSGMPDQPRGVPSPADQLFTDENPSEALTGYWNNYEGPAVPACWSYSNTAFVTLGFAVTAMYPELTRNQYDKLLAQYVTGPLALTHTGPTADPALFAKGYNRSGDQETPASIIAADLKSNGSDMLRLLKAYAGGLSVSDPIQKAIARTLEQQGDFPICGKNTHMGMGLAWQIHSTEAGDLYRKNGSTAEGGFSCDVQVAPQARFGLAILTNEVWHDKPNDGVNNPTELGTQLREMLVPQLA